MTVNYIEYRNINALGFVNKKKFYIYDRYSNNVLLVSQVLYKHLDDFLELTIEDAFKKYGKIISIDKIKEIYDDIAFFQKELNSLIAFDIPFLSIASKDKAEDKINNMLSNCLNRLLLNITEDCNLRCEYCIYSGKYIKARTHNSNHPMTWDTAKKAVDFFIAHSTDASTKFIGFYGGEPLLNFEIIEKIVEYVSKIDKQIFFAITTNGTLLKGKILDFLISYDVRITVSLDGPGEIHDRNRKFINNSGCFNVVMKNIGEIRAKFLTYFQEKLCINATLTPFNDVKKELSDFFNSNRFPSIKNTDNFSMKFVNPDDNSFYKDTNYKNWKKNYLEEFHLHYINKHIQGISEELELNIILLVNHFHNEIEAFHFRDMTPIDKYKYYWPNGSCVPGMRSLFVTSQGDYYPCEKLYDLKDMVIGNVDLGIDLKYINNELTTYSDQISQLCKKCWAYRFCGECWLSARKNNKIDKTEREEMCNSTKRNWTELIASYIDITENNPSAFEYLIEEKKHRYIYDMIKD